MKQNVVKHKETQTGYYGHVMRKDACLQVIIQGHICGKRRVGGQRRRLIKYIMEWSNGIMFCSPGIRHYMTMTTMYDGVRNGESSNQSIKSRMRRRK